jgi:SAM-dependent methyltransferase
MDDWMLDERAHAGLEHLDPAYAATYEQKSATDPAEDIAVLQGLGLDADSVLLDMGAGPGTFALAVAPLCREVIAVDVSPAMTDLLRRRVDAAGLANVTVVEAGFLSYDHVGPPVDVVHTRNALHQLPDFWKAIALARLHALLRPGGVLRLRDLVFDLEPATAGPGIDAWLAGAVPDPSRGFTAAELAAHVRTEHSTFSWLLEAMLERVGFTVLDRSFRRSAYGAYTCRRS